MKHTCALLLALVALCFVPSLFCQSTDATISGTVLDQSGKAIPYADLTVVNESTGVQYPSKTNNIGIYTISILPPGQYRIEVSKIGFKTVIKPSVTLNVQSALALNFTLPIGATSESITVEAASPLLNATDGSVSTVIDQKFVANIPLNGRSFQDLISMTPGVLTQSPQTSQSLGYNGDFSVNGQRTESNYYTIDGVSANTGAGNGYGQGQAGTGGSLGGSTALGTTQSLISVDSLQEFRVNSSSYSAEYGRSPGGQFALASRSGTNSFHGSAFDYVRNDTFDANDWFNDRYSVAKPALHQNDFGGTLGGFVWLPRVYNGKGNTFFFVSYEGLRLTQPQAASLQYVPALSLRTSAASSLIPLLNAFPVPTGTEVQVACNGTTYVCPTGSPKGTLVPSGLASFTGASTLPSQIDSTSVRLDRVLSSRMSLFFRYGNTPSTTTSRSLSVLTHTRFSANSYTFGATNQLTNASSNVFRFGYAHSDNSLSGAVDNFGGAQPIDLASGMGASGFSRPYPVFLINITGVGSSELSISPSANVSNQWNLVDTFTITSGKHQLKVGIDYRQISSPLDPASPLVEGYYSSRQGLIQNQSLAVVTEKTVSAEPRFRQFASFAEDQWHVTSRLMVTTGLRWELAPPPTETHGNDAFTLQGSLSSPTTLEVAPRGTPLWKTGWYNFAPRIGMAWQAHQTPGWETIVRLGGGIFFDSADELAARGFSGLGFLAQQYSYGTGLPVTASQLNLTPSTVAPYTSAPIYAYPTHLQLPYSLQWNTAIQQAFGKAQTLTISYVGAAGRRLLGWQEFSLGSLNPSFGTIYYIPSGLNSNYQSLQSQFQRSLPKGLQALASYTWSHSIDVGSTATSLPVTRGNSDFDVRNNFVAGMAWDVPETSPNRLLNALVSGWGTDARLMLRSGFPLTVGGSLLVDPGTGSLYSSGVNIVAGQPLYLYGSQYPGGRTVNRSAFVATGANVGDAPRNGLRGFGAAQLNLALRRELPIKDRVRLQLRAETFNLLNHPNFGVIDTTLTDATFGQATKSLNQSLGTMAAQYQQGGPRSFQFTLKVLF